MNYLQPCAKGAFAYGEKGWVPVYVCFFTRNTPFPSTSSGQVGCLVRLQPERLNSKNAGGDQAKACVRKRRTVASFRLYSGIFFKDAFALVNKFSPTASSPRTFIKLK